jgi:hypothetical protein
LPNIAFAKNGQSYQSPIFLSKEANLRAKTEQHQRSRQEKQDDSKPT